MFDPSFAATLPVAVRWNEMTALFVEFGAVLLILAALGRLARRTGFSPVPLYLLAGLALAVANPPDIAESVVAIETQIAVVLLLFMLGLEYSGEEVVGALRGGYRAGLLDIALNFPPGFVVGLLLGWTPLEALLLGGITYISSSSIVAKVLDDLGRLGNRETPAILSVLVFEDLAMAPYLPLIAVLLAGGTLAASVLSVGVALAAVAVVLFVTLRHGHSISRRLAHPSDEVVLLTMFGLLLVAGGVGEALEMSAGVVAFLVGLMISGPMADRARQLLGPLRDLFAAIFFLLFGLQIDIAGVPGVLGVAAGLWILTIVTKLAVGWYAARGMSAVPGRLRAGTALVARGEFSIVIAGLAVTAGIDSELRPLAATYVLLTAVSGPLLTRYAGALARLFTRPPRAAANTRP